LRSRIDCLSCGNVSIKDDPFFDISLPIVTASLVNASDSSASPSSSMTSMTSGSNLSAPKSPTLEYMGSFFTSIGESLGFSGKNTRLESCLAAFCSPEKLEGRERYYCERCRTKVPSLKTLSIQELPNVYNSGG
jgi:ubiquitin C-terminal hydrolase